MGKMDVTDGNKKLEHNECLMKMSEIFWQKIFLTNITIPLFIHTGQVTYNFHLPISFEMGKH